MSPKDKGDREAILSRRRLFVASAMASIVVAEPACDTLFRPCLEPAMRPDAEPTTCLAVPLSPRDASVSIVTDAGSGADAAAEPCLSVARPPPGAGRDAATEPPRPCLGPSRPRPCLSPPPQPPQPCLKPSGGGFP